MLLKAIMELHLYKKASIFFKDNTLKYFKVKKKTLSGEFCAASIYTKQKFTSHGINVSNVFTSEISLMNVETVVEKFIEFLKL